jgi:hypothetical protein
MKNVIKFLSVVILFLSTTLSAQRVYDITLKNNTLSITETSKPKSTSIKTVGEVQFEFYDLRTKVVLGVEKKSNSTDETLLKYMSMNDGDTLLKERVKIKQEGDCVEYFYYADCYITNYFTPQKLFNGDYLLQIKDDAKIITYTIKNGIIKKETL